MIGPLLSLCLFAHPRPTDQTRFTVEVNEGRSPFGPFSFSFPSPPSAVADRSVNPQKEEGARECIHGVRGWGKAYKKNKCGSTQKSVKDNPYQKLLFYGKN